MGMLEGFQYYHQMNGRLCLLHHSLVLSYFSQEEPPYIAPSRPKFPPSHLIEKSLIILTRQTPRNLMSTSPISKYEAIIILSVILSKINIFVTLRIARLTKKSVWKSIVLVLVNTMLPKNVSRHNAITTENTTMCVPLAGIVAEESKMTALTTSTTSN